MLRVTRQSVDVIGQKGSDLRVATQSVDVVGLTDPDIRVYRVALEYLRELVIHDIGASSTIALSQGAASSTKSLLASSALALSQGDTTDLEAIPYTGVTLSLGQAASVVLLSGSHAANTLALTQAASYERIRNRSAESTLLLLSLTEYIGPKWVSASSAIVLTHDTYLPEIYEVSAESTIVCDAVVSFAGTIRLEADSTIILSQYADTLVKIRHAYTQIDLTQSASFDRILTASSHIDLSQEASSGAVDMLVESQLSLTHEARYQPLPQFTGSQIELSQSTWTNIRLLYASSQINLTQAEKAVKPIRAFGESELSTTAWIPDPVTGEVTEQDTGLRHSVDAVHIGTKSAESILSFNQTIDLTHVRVGGAAVSATSTIVLTQEGRLSEVGESASVINIGHAAEGWAGHPGDSVLELSQGAVVTFSKTFTCQTELEIRHAVAYTLIVASTSSQYSPFVGESSDPNAPTPPSTSLQGPMAGIQVPFQMVYPSVGPVTDSLSLKTPALGNLDRLSFNRIQRETRGGTLVIFADPNWPKIQSLSLTFTGMKSVEAQALLTFIDAHLGLEIGLIDWEHRYWRGVITEPDQPIVEDSFDSFTASFVFQGELDPTWNPQVVPPSLRYSAIRSEQEDGYYVPNEPQLPSVPEADYMSAEADSTIKIGYPIYIKSNGHLDPAQANAQATTGAVGVSISDTAAAAVCKYITEGKVTRSDWTEIAGVTSLTPGVSYYLSPTTAGHITSTAPTTVGQFVVSIGRAISTTELDIEIGPPILL